MIFFWADGRLGNQLFQYAFLQTIRRGKEWIIVTGFDELKTVFDAVNVINLRSESGVSKRVIKYLKKLLRFLVNRKLISVISVNLEHAGGAVPYMTEGSGYIQKQGTYKWLRFVKLGFFQSECFFSKQVIDHLEIKRKYFVEASLILDKIPDSFSKVFVHIRLGDYKDFFIYGKSVLLPYDYFHKCIDYFIDNIKDPFFIFLSDEPKLIAQEFDYINNKLISTDNHFGIDFAIMTLCNGAILSPSSFGWWGSYFMKNRITVFAPKHWLGFSSNVDCPHEPLASYMIPFKVSPTRVNQPTPLANKNAIGCCKIVLSIRTCVVFLFA
jgi:hypothetical protein